MIFLSLNRNTGKVVLVSIPRDIWITEIQAKINTAYHYGGIDLAKKTVGDVLGQRINYVAILDFDGFEKAVDLLGGIEVDVQRTFDDFWYPIPGKETDLCDGDKQFKCRYEHLHFEAGQQLMSGGIALKYVRSRNAEGDEGTDFARAARQQLFLQGFKQKLSSADVYLHPEKIYGLWKIFMQYSVTDLKMDQYGSLLQLGIKINWDQLKMAALNGNLLVTPSKHYSKQWVLVPKAGDWTGIKAYVKEILE